MGLKNADTPFARLRYSLSKGKGWNATMEWFCFLPHILSALFEMSRVDIAVCPSSKKMLRWASRLMIWCHFHNILHLLYQVSWNFLLQFVDIRNCFIEDFWKIFFWIGKAENKLNSATSELTKKYLKIHFFVESNLKFNFEVLKYGCDIIYPAIYSN